MAKYLGNLDIDVFYPVGEVEYEKGIDYNPEVLTSVFTSELSKIYIKYIFEKLGPQPGKVLIWKITITSIPLLLHIIMRKDVSFIFLFTKDEECIKLISNVMTLLKCDNKCSITKSNTVSFTNIPGLIFMGVDELPIIKTLKNTSLINSGVALILIKTQINTLLNLDKNSNFRIETPYTMGKVTIIVQLNNDKEIEYSDEYSNYQSLADTNYKRTVSENKSNNQFLENQRKKIEEERKQLEIDKQLLDKEKKKFHKKWFSEKLNENDDSDDDGKESDKDEEEQQEDFTIKGDKYHYVKRVDLSLASSKHPKVGGWLQIDNGVQNFYLFGVENLKSPTTVLNRKNTALYGKSLTKFLTDVISFFNPFEDLDIKLLFSDKYIDLWIKTWTHESFDINENYETLETVGDVYFATSFVSYLYDTYPNIDRAEITNLKGNIGSKPSLRQIGWALKFDQWLRMGENANSNTNTAEDIVEAFCATLQIVTNDILLGTGLDLATTSQFVKTKSKVAIPAGPGPGIMMIRAFVNFLFSTCVITDEMFMEPSKTALEQSVQGIGGENKPINNEYINGSLNKSFLHRMTLTWVDSAMAFFKQNRIRMDRVIARAEGKSKKAVSAQVYTLGILNLKAKGYSMEYFKNLKFQIQMSQFPPGLVDAVIAKAKREFGPTTHIEFYNPRTLNTMNSVAVFLLAIVKDSTRKGTKHSLAQIINRNNDTNAAKLSALEKYINEK